MKRPGGAGRAGRRLTVALIAAAILGGCRAPVAGHQSTVAAPPAGGGSATIVLAPEAPAQPGSPPASPSPLVIQIQSTTQAASSGLAVATLTLAPPVSPAASPSAELPTIGPAAEPVIFTTIGLDQRCGRGDIVAYDGHTLYATPHLTHDNSNFLERLPEGAEVDIIDCRLWSDADNLSWLAVRTAQHKLGWMLIQPDKFYVTLFPIPHAPPPALTGIPAGTTVAYVPPSECREGPVSDQATATSIGVDLIPVVGDLKGLGEAATGCDMVTGEPLGDWRWFGLLGLVGMSEVALLRHGDEAADVARISDDVAGSLRYSDEAALAAARNADTAADFIRRLDEAGAVSASADAARAAERGVGFTDETVQALGRMEQPCSFAAGTIVHTPAGPTPIESVRPATAIWAYDETGGGSGYFLVTAVMARIDPLLMIVTIGAETVLTTADHPFLTAGGWRRAGALEIGDRARSAGGRLGVVNGLSWRAGPQLMFTLTVAEAHTYAVGDGRWIVHNACSRILRRNLGQPAWADEATEWQAHHVIPGEFEGHPFVTRATDAGWQIDGAGNGIALPKWEEDAAQVGLPAHRGYHRTYSAEVGGLLDNLNAQALDENWSNAQSRAALEALIPDLTARLKRSAGSRLPY